MSAFGLTGTNLISFDKSPLDQKPTNRHSSPSKQKQNEGEPGANSYAELVAHYGIVNFTFSYRTGFFHALDVEGGVVAKGKTVRDLLSSLIQDRSNQSGF